MDDAKCNRGFTLVELLVTLTVIALLTGLAAPAMARLIDNARLHAATEQLAGELRRARSHAISHQQTIYLVLQGAGARWCFGWSSRRDCNCRAQQPDAACATGDSGGVQVHRLLSDTFRTVRLQRAGAPGKRQLVFSPVRGAATAVSFRLMNGRGEQRVIISPLGRIRHCRVGAAGDAGC